MSRITRILAAVDLSDVRDAAFNRALSVARASKADLYLLHVVPSNDRFSWGAAQRFHRMNELRHRAEVEGLTVQTDEQQGDPAGVITLHADARGVDLIVLGTNGRKGWQRLRQGSVAERVLRRTSRRVLVVPNGEERGGNEPFRHVLVAADASPAWIATVDEAMRLAGGVPDRLTVLHVVDAVDPESRVGVASRWAVPEYRRQVSDDARRRLEASMPSRLRGAANVALQVMTGVPHETILHYAAGVNADLVVVGASRRFMHLGSATARVLRGLDRPLFVVPAPNKGQRVVEIEGSDTLVAA
jgi:nucleotide-binding universal stress UspA family protein